jgi:S-DNA-T family DNA segregation ATPase FtsK/SpoIIIE
VTTSTKRQTSAAAAPKSRGRKKPKHAATKRKHAARSRRPAARPRRPAGFRARFARSSRTASRAGRGGGEVRAVARHHRADLWGLGFVVLGLISGLGIYLGQAGVFGRAVDTGLGVVIGVVRLVAPVVFVLAGGLLLRAGRADEPDEAPTRAVGGLVLLLISVTGLLHLVAFRAEGDPVADLRRAGGGLGAVAAHPLRGVVGGFGAAFLLVALATVAVLVLTGTTMRVTGQRLAVAGAPFGRLVVRSIQNLFQVETPAGSDATDAVVAAREAATNGSGADPTSRSSGKGAVGGTDGPGGRDANDTGGPTPAGGAGPSATRDRPAVVLPVPPPDPADDEQEDASFVAAPAGAAPVGRGTSWSLPPARLLHRSGAQEVDRAMVEETGRTLEHALAEHGVETRLVGMVVGPTVTRYELELGPGVKVARVTSLHRDIAYAMATPDVRILAPIPGRQAIGVEVPNSRRQLVTVGDILASEESRRADHPLEVAVGRDIMGRSVMANLATMPHLLIAGATGAGKSSCINSLITSVLMRTTPDQVRMILVDPKRVELGQYNRLPHLLTQVVTNPKKAANALTWTVREMERRYDLLSEVGVRDITGYNAAYDRGDLHGETSEVLRRTLGHLPERAGELGFPRLPYILVVVDELNDLMMVAARDVEDSICRIAQMARAVGIHLVIATQRPSVNVITGVIKANVPSRIAFAVSSLADSRVVLDQQGAERLVGRGDMLLLGPSSSIAQRIQGAWVTEEEVRAVAAHWRRQSPDVAYVEGVEGSDEESASLPGMEVDAGGGDDEDDAALVRQARELVVRSQLGSTSMLQRKLRVGFARAGRLMDLLEQQGVVGPSTGSKAREVLMSPEELDQVPTASG